MWTALHSDNLHESETWTIDTRISHSPLQQNVLQCWKEIQFCKARLLPRSKFVINISTALQIADGPTNPIETFVHFYMTNFKLSSDLWPRTAGCNQPRETKHDMLVVWKQSYVTAEWWFTTPQVLQSVILTGEACSAVVRWWLDHSCIVYVCLMMLHDVMMLILAAGNRNPKHRKSK